VKPSAIFLALALALAPLPALAHKVIASVFPSGAQIEGEIGFSNGDMAKAATVTVTDPTGRALGQAVTDDNGAFTFTPTEAVDHVFHADLGGGHVANVTMAAADVAKIVEKAKTAGNPGPVAAAAIDPEVIATIVRDEMRPLRQEIDAYKEKNDLQAILGGIGYIAGLFGLGFYTAARRRLAAV